MPSIGERLKSTREAKGLSLEEVAKVTKVQRRILEAIEENQVQELLEPAYAKIFIKKYATFLGLDGAAVVKEYLRLHGPLPEASLSPKAQGVREEASEGSGLKFLATASLGITALIGVAFLGYLGWDLLGGSTAPASRRSPPTVSTAGRSKARIASESSRVASAEGESRSPTGKSGSLAGESRSPASESKLLVPRSQPLRLTIRTKNDVWMQVKSDGIVIFQNVLAKGSQESWTAKRELELWTGNAGAMELTLNDKPLGSPGYGVKKGIKVTHRGLE